MMTPPRTMPRQGLSFLRELATEMDAGSILEIGPLFGCSTLAIAAGRPEGTTIHSIDTFRSAPWIERRFGFDLDRHLFEKFTAPVTQLIVHQGRMPGIIGPDWSDQIGLFFDSAARDPHALRRNIDLVKPHLAKTAIICGGGFVGKAHDLVKVANELTHEFDAELLVCGQVWALAGNSDPRVVNALNRANPGLEDISVVTIHDGAEDTLPAASWSKGDHQHRPLDSFGFQSAHPFKAEATTFRNGKLVQTADLFNEHIFLEGADTLMFALPEGFGLQLCLFDGKSTTNSKIHPSGMPIPLHQKKIAAVRLCRQ